jgi:hypothetical protein
MVKSMFIVFFSLFLTSCGYFVLPHKYLRSYTAIVTQSSKTPVFPAEGVYMVEDTFLTRDYSKLLNKKIKSYRYIFLYKNNLMAKLTTPFIDNGKGYVFSTEELADSISNGFFDKPQNWDRIDWSYFEMKDKAIKKYSFDFEVSSGANALSQVRVFTSNYFILRNGIVPESHYNKVKDTTALKVHTYVPCSIAIKPDSSKSEFIKIYRKYLATGKRAFYPGSLDRDMYTY